MTMKKIAMTIKLPQNHFDRRWSLSCCCFDGSGVIPDAILNSNGV